MTVTARLDGQSTFTRIMPSLGSVLVALDCQSVVGERAHVVIAGTDIKLTLSVDRLLVGRQGYCVQGWLVEHQCQPGEYFGHRYLGRVIIEQAAYDVPAQAFLS